MSVDQVSPFQKVNHCKLIWLIQNVYQCRTLRKGSIDGPDYGSKCASPFPWSLKLGQSTAAEEKGISLYVRGVNLPKDMTVNLRVYVRKQTNVKPLLDEKYQVILDSEKFWESPLISTNDEFEEEQIKEKFCKFWEIHVELMWNETVEPEIAVKKSLESQFKLLCFKEVGTDLKQFYKNARFSDIYIRCDDKEVPAHKAILEARCPYFAQKISSYTGGEWEGAIAGLSPPRDLDVMNTFLMYLYTGDIESLVEGGPLPVGIHKCAQRMRKYDLEWLTSPLQLCGYSRVVPGSVGHAWKVGNLYEMFKHKNEPNVIQSKSIGNRKVSFKLTVKRNKSKHSGDCISVFLHLDQLEKGDGVHTIFELSVSKEYSKISKRSIGDLTLWNTIGFPEFAPFDSFLEIPNVVFLISITYFEGGLHTHIDKISINCAVKPEKGSNAVSLTSEFGSGPHGWVNLSWDLGQLFATENYSDCVVVVGDDRFPAHRVVLAARSRYFSTMFDVKEGECAGSSKEMDILVDKDTQISPETMKVILDEMYTGSCKIDSQSAKNIYDSAKFFGLRRLETKCKTYLKMSDW